MKLQILALAVMFLQINVSNAIDQNFLCSPMVKTKCKGFYKEQTNNLVAVIGDVQENMKLKIDSIREAKKSIYIQTLEFVGDESGWFFAKELVKKVSNGVKVIIVMDTLSNIPNYAIKKYLKKNGVELYGQNSLRKNKKIDTKRSFGLNMAQHQKFLIVDESISYIGGLNFSNKYFSVGEIAEHRWRDQDLVVKGSSVGDMIDLFFKNIEYFKSIRKYKDIKEKDIKAKKIDKMNPVILDNIKVAMKLKPQLNWVNSKVQFFQARPRKEETYIEQLYLKAIQQAKVSINIANAYFIPSPNLVKELKLAASRGVDVRVVTNSLTTNDLPAMTTVSRMSYRTLLEKATVTDVSSRVKIYEFNGTDGVGNGTMHSKFATFDGKRSVVGSHNMDPRSRELNTESVLFVEEDEVTEELDVLFEEDVQNSTLVSYKTAKKYESPKGWNKIHSNFWNTLRSFL